MQPSHFYPDLGTENALACATRMAGFGAQRVAQTHDPELYRQVVVYFVV